MKVPASKARPVVSQPKSPAVAAPGLSHDQVLARIFPNGIPAEVLREINRQGFNAAAPAVDPGTLTLQRNVADLQSEIEQFPQDIRDSLDEHIQAAEAAEAARYARDGSIPAGSYQDRQPDGPWEFHPTLGPVAVVPTQVDSHASLPQPLPDASASSGQSQPTTLPAVAFQERIQELRSAPLMQNVFNVESSWAQPAAAPNASGSQPQASGQELANQL
eukprot:8424779-Pyramimonas_sp.AAC.1